MINITENQTDLEFGTGDICIAGGSYLGENGGKVGMVAFMNQEPREIGSVGVIKANKKYKVGDFPVIMTFTKPESIDVLIKHLEIAKKEMEECKNV